MGTKLNRLDQLKNLVLSVANREIGELNLDTLAASKLEFPKELFYDIPTVLINEEIHNSMAMGFEYLVPCMKAVVLGCKNIVLPYLVSCLVQPGGSTTACFSDSTVFESAGEKFTHFKDRNGQAVEIQLHYTPNGDLRTRYPEIEKFLAEHTVNKLKDYWELEDFVDRIKNENPLFLDNSVDIVVVDGLNFEVGPHNLENITAEIYRVLKKGGIFLFSLAVSDERANDEGFLCEEDIERITGLHKYYGLQCIGRGELPFKIVNGKEIRIHNFVAFKGKEGRCLERNQAVIYNGPWKEIRDDDGHIYPRGKRVAVCDKTFNILLNTPPYKGQFTYIAPYIEIPLEKAADFPCCAGILYRDPKVTKGMTQMSYSLNSQDCCGTGNSHNNACCSTGESAAGESCCC